MFMLQCYVNECKRCVHLSFLNKTVLKLAFIVSFYVVWRLLLLGMRVTSLSPKPLDQDQKF